MQWARGTLLRYTFYITILSLSLSFLFRIILRFMSKIFFHNQFKAIRNWHSILEHIFHHYHYHRQLIHSKKFSLFVHVIITTATAAAAAAVKVDCKHNSNCEPLCGALIHSPSYTQLHCLFLIQSIVYRCEPNSVCHKFQNKTLFYVNLLFFERKNR